MEEGKGKTRESSFTWKIDSFWERTKDAKRSQTFKLGRADFELIIFGRDSICSTCLTYYPVYLHRVDTGTTSSDSTFYKLCVIDRFGKEYRHSRQTSLHHAGKLVFLMVIQAGELRNNKEDLLPEGTLTLQLLWCEGGGTLSEGDIQAAPHITGENKVSDLSLKTEKSKFRSSKDKCTNTDNDITTLLEVLSKDFEHFYETKTDTDCVLTIGEAQFPVHRQVLAARSPVFEAMFHHDTSESRSGIVDIRDLDSGVMSDVLFYVYTGKIRSLSPDTAVPMYVAADKYALMELKDKCIDFLLHNLTMGNFCDVAVLTHTYGETDLENEVTSFIEERLEVIVDSENWQNFLKNESVLASRLLCSALMANKGKMKLLYSEVSKAPSVP